MANLFFKLQLVCFFLPCLTNAAGNIDTPTATVKNGTLLGKYVAEWDQDHFLGIPYAVPPLGDLRFAWPKSLNTSFDEPRSATEYGFSCYQYGSTFNLSEDCLTLNVIRPAGTSSVSNLPVLVWIYGGGLYVGSSADPQYNLSGITQVGQRIQKPIITVSINYRLGVWGFFQSPQILAEGSSNAGLLDQRLALRWIKENIASFGGNANNITIWGESAGAQSIGYHIHSYDGRDDGLFHAAIMESGGPIGTFLAPLSHYASPVENLTRTTGCYASVNQLACLRGLSSEQLFENRVSQVWNPIVDGDFLTAYPSTLMLQNKFIRVPLLTGANSDEGITFGTQGLDNETAIFNHFLSWSRSYAISPPTARHLLELYPNDSANEPPYYIKNATIFPENGLQWRRECAIAGDIVIIAQRRKVCEEYASNGLPVYSYRFDTYTWDKPLLGAQHFVNVAFSFQNISGHLGPLPEFKNYSRLSENIGLAYTSFVNDHDPNTNRGNSTLPYWPQYSMSRPQNMVLNSNGSFIEADDFRKEGIAFINNVSRELLA